MPVSLAELRAAAAAYCASSVTTTVDAPAPGGGGRGPVGASTEFKFNVRSSNPPAASGGIQLKNVVYHVQVSGPAVLRAPYRDAHGVARATLAGGQPLADGWEGTEYYLSPTSLVVPGGDALSVLAPGDTDSILGLPARTTGSGTVTLKARVYADVDLDYLFPRGGSNAQFSRSFDVR
ncbi:MAG TPA: hypothetical protein PKA64_17925 [Myxococcota bacterium]|nr:hypothetical protein [Myxococcota bacterium]